jgi:hypothetical protein
MYEKFSRNPYAWQILKISPPRMRVRERTPSQARDTISSKIGESDDKGHFKTNKPRSEACFARNSIKGV